MIQPVRTGLRAVEMGLLRPMALMEYLSLAAIQGEYPISVVLPTYPGNISQTSPDFPPTSNFFPPEVLVKGPLGIFQRVCG